MIKKLISYSPVYLFCISLFLPVLLILSFFKNYDLIINYLAYFTIVILVIILNLIFVLKNYKIDKLNKIFSEILPITSLFNLVCYSMISAKFSILLFASVIFSIYFLINCRINKYLKIIPLVIVSILFLPCSSIILITLTFGNFGSNTVVDEINSPDGQHILQIVDSDQGALGGDTIVKVYKNKNCDINLFVIFLKKTPKIIYIGDWQEYKSMTVKWKNNHEVLINNKKYNIYK